MKFLIFILSALCFTGVSHSSVIPNGSFMINSDFSYTSARDLWKGSGEEIIFSESNGDTNVHAKTQFYNLGLTASYGLPFQMQMDLRIDYTKSEIKGANHPNAAVGGNGAQVNALSKVALKLSKVIFTKGAYAFDMSFEYVNPVEDTPHNPSFIAVNDFSNHYIIGFKQNYLFNSKLSVELDTKYVIRSKAKKLDSLDLPANQLAYDLLLTYANTDKVSLGTGLSGKHTFSGPDISTSSFTVASALAGHGVFYAARERFVGYNLFTSYYMTPSSWLGVARFKKFWGRNTDRSETWTIFAGTLF